MYQTNNVIVTISRLSGSRGRKIGKLVAEKLGWNVYDKELLEMTGEEANCPPEVVAKAEHAHASMFGLSWGRAGVDYSYNMPLNDKLFNIEAGIIRSIADKENAVIVGRCADGVLEGYAPIISIFVHASEENRVQYVMERDNLTREEALKRLKLIDKTRATYHNFYADTKWGQRENYDLIINSEIGIEASADVICSYVKAFLPIKQNA